MKKYLTTGLLTGLLFLLGTLCAPCASAMLSMELTHGVAGAIPVAVVPFATPARLPQDVSAIIANDLAHSGRFKVYDRQNLTQFPTVAEQVSAPFFNKLGTDNIVVGKVMPLGGDEYQVSFQLIDLLKGKGKEGIALQKQWRITGSGLRKLSHHISDMVYQHITGIRGIFSTRIAYVVVQRPAHAPPRYLLEVSDQDGYNPRPILSSAQPLMSPSWSPNGRQIAYVSFEKQQASIYLHEVATGARRLLCEFPGINGAPAWSPDGSKLAVVLSRSGSPNIYVMNVQGGSLKQITHDFYINTEPAWSPDGKSLLFTSNRSGGPQIYEVKLATGATARLSYDGNYNARASYTQDGKYVAMIHKVAGIYNIALLDLDSGHLRVLNGTVGDSASPSVAPNGSMIIYDTVYGGRNVLGMVSADGRIQLRLPARNGEAQDPAWSPYA